MTVDFSIFTWRTPWTEEPGGLCTVHGWQRVGHNIANGQHNHRTGRRRNAVCLAVDPVGAGEVDVSALQFPEIELLGNLP